MICWNLGANNNDPGKKSRIESKPNLKNQSSEIVSYTSAIAWRLSHKLLASMVVCSFLKYKGKQGTFDGTFDISQYQQHSHGLFKNRPQSLSIMLNLMINSGPQDNVTPSIDDVSHLHLLDECLIRIFSEARILHQSCYSLVIPCYVIVVIPILSSLSSSAVTLIHSSWFGFLLSTCPWIHLIFHPIFDCQWAIGSTRSASTGSRRTFVGVCCMKYETFFTHPSSSQVCECRVLVWWGMFVCLLNYLLM